MRVKFSWELVLWLLFVVLGSLIESDAIPAGRWLKLATGLMMALKTVTTFFGKPVLSRDGGEAQS